MRRSNYICPSSYFKSKKEEFTYYIRLLNTLSSSCESLSNSGVTTIDIKTHIDEVKIKIENFEFNTCPIPSSVEEPATTNPECGTEPATTNPECGTEPATEPAIPI